MVNAHLTYLGWSEGGLNNVFQQKAKDFFISKGFEVLETIIEKGYDIEEEVKKHLESEIIILQTPINWLSAAWIYKKYVDEVLTVVFTVKHFLKAMEGQEKIQEASMEPAESCRGKSFW